MDRPRACQSWRLVFCAACAAWLAAGCSSLPQPWRKVPLDASTGFYETASLSYRLDAGKLQQPLDVVRVEGQRVAYEQVASSPLPDQSIGTLSIVYPHPAGRQGFAQVRFNLDSVAPSAAPSKPAKSWNPFAKPSDRPPPPKGVTSSQPEVHESWALDISKAESDAFFKLISNMGFYNTDRPGTGGAHLAVDINGKKLDKDWEQVPELGELVRRVRREGQLLAFSRPDVMGAGRGAVIASTSAYAAMLAQDGAPDPRVATAQAVPSPFSMAPPPAQAEAVARQDQVLR